jgi:hypothetical protein
MDQAWDLAVERAADQYDIFPNADDDYTNSDHQVVNSIQSEIFEELGGDLDEYREKCY